jgi:hypothetical protein
MGHRKGDPRPDEQVNAPPGEIARTVALMYGVMKQPKCNMADPAAVAERYDWYVGYCIENDLKPTVAGMALAYGYTREWLLRCKDGVVKSVPEDSILTLKRAWDMLTALMEEYMVNGHINPIPGIFLLKNNHGYRDQSEQVIIKRDPYEAGDPEEIARRYLAGMPAALPQESAPVQENAPVVETVVVDQTGRVE